ncbi:MAG: hypothetical protein OXC37_05980 [Bdellovibrionaceae bacterium]|nr:hypothetical protein [Pseudobdellovibrionaceae bacterium]
MFRKFFIIIFIFFSFYHLISNSQLSENEQGDQNLSNSDFSPFVEKTKEGIQYTLSQYFVSSCKINKKEFLTQNYSGVTIKQESEEETKQKTPALTQYQAMQISSCYLESSKTYVDRTIPVKQLIKECSEDILEDMEMFCSESFFNLALEFTFCMDREQCRLIKQNGIYENIGYGSDRAIFIVSPFALPYDISKIDIEIQIGGNSRAYYPEYLSEEVSCTSSLRRNLNCNIVNFPPK